MSTQFTPGPWAYRIYGDSEMGDTFHLGQLDDENGGIYGTILEGGLVLASDDENEANAHLIAASPELYDAAFTLLLNQKFGLDPGGFSTVTIRNEDLSQLRAALAKARGDLAEVVGGSK